MNLGLYSSLSAYYFHFYGALGLLLPYFSLWMADRGLGAAQIGMVLAAHGLTRIVMPPLWGYFADHSGQRLRLIQLASLASAMAFAVLPFAQGFSGILGSVVLFSIFWNATMPQFEAYTLGALAQHGGDYSRIRLWGSVGFVLAVIGGGAGFDHFGIDWLPASIVIVLLFMSAGAWLLPNEQRKPTHHETLSIWHVLRRPAVIALFVSCMLHQFSFAPYYGFFSLYLETHGWDKSLIGILWASGVVAEIVMFIWTGALIRRFGLRAIFLVALITTVIRWAGLEFVVESLVGLLALQMLHLSSFGLYHACAVNFIHREFGGRLQGRGQALHVSLSFGVGGALGSAISGLMWDALGPEPAYRMAAVAAGLATVIAYRWVR